MTANFKKLFAGSALLIAAIHALNGCSNTPTGQVQSTPNAVLPPSLSVGNGPPEDIKVVGSTAFVSNVGDGSVLKLDLAHEGAAITFIPAATDGYSSAWGLCIVAKKNWLLSIQNQPYDFNPAHAQTGRVAAYDLTTGKKVKSWELPSKTVANAIDVDAAGNIYVGDFGPSTRILKIDPSTDEVSIWATSAQWVDGGFGVGGMVFNGKGIYAGHNNALWYIAINADGSAASPAVVKIEGDPIIFADGMAWVDNAITYAENDAPIAGAHGTIFQIKFTTPTTATRSAVQSDLRDPSGVTTANVNGQAYLLVNESQLGYAFGADKGQPSIPYQVKVFER